MTKKNTTHRTRERKSRYGHLIDPPVTDEVEVTTYTNETSYGGKRWRTAYKGDRFTHPVGTKPEAVILDIDGTLQDWGASTVSKGMAFAKKHHGLGRVLIVVTAREHEYMYESSFNWLMHNLPYPFVGPFMRSMDDPRTSGEFKREVALALENFYVLKGAVDDNEFVCKMWDEFALTHEGFEVERCGYTRYSDWRSDLPRKESWKNYGSYSSGSSYNGYYGSATLPTGHTDDIHPGQHWVGGHWDKEAKEWISGHWEDDDPQPKHRPAGQRSFADVDSDWGEYFNARQRAGAYDAEDTTEDGMDKFRSDLESIVRHDYPGYSDDELADMTIPELQDLAQLTSLSPDCCTEAIFDDADLGPEDGRTRNERVQERLDLEDDVYAAYPDMTMPEIEELDILVLREMLAKAKAEEAEGLVVETEEILDELGEEGHARADEAQTEVA